MAERTGAGGLIHLHASRSHYADHLWPIWRALPDDVRGVAWSTRAGWWGDTVRRRPDGLHLVASATDARRTRGPYVYVEHGAGQSYLVQNGSYSGGPGHGRCVLFIAPNDMVGDRWRAAYPDTPVAVVGSPIVDVTAKAPAVAHRSTAPASADGRPVCAFTFHWECALVPETRSALPHYRRELPAIVDELRAAGVDVIGHGHPRAWPQLADVWRTIGVEPVPAWPDVVARADVLVADNTSALYEWAALDRPVVVLNAPWYRRDVDHGLRFWTHLPGPQADEAGDVVELVADAVTSDRWATVRRRVVDDVYPRRDGLAAERAGTAIVEVL